MKRYEDYDQVSGIFTSYDELTNVTEGLAARGIPHDDMSILMSETTRDSYFSAKEANKAPEGLTVGSISGGLLGALIGGLTLVGNVLAPGVGFLVAGPLVGALTGGAIGMATGGLIGALVGAGIPEHEAKFYEDALKEEGNILLVAHVPHDLAGEIRSIFQRHGARSLKVRH